MPSSICAEKSIATSISPINFQVLLSRLLRANPPLPSIQIVVVVVGFIVVMSCRSIWEEWSFLFYWISVFICMFCVLGPCHFCVIAKARFSLQPQQLKFQGLDQDRACEWQMVLCLPFSWVTSLKVPPFKCASWKTIMFFFGLLPRCLPFLCCFQ